MSKFIPTSGFHWIYSKKFNLNRDTSNSSNGSVLKLDLENQKKITRITQ